MNTSSSPSAPKRGHGYPKRVKRMMVLLSGLDGKLSRAELRRQGHYWLEAQTVEEGRRLRSPSERLHDKLANATPTDSVKV